MVKKVNSKQFPGGNNAKISSVSRKLAKILTVSGKSHHPIETLRKLSGVLTIYRLFENSRFLLLHFVADRGILNAYSE